MNIDTLLHDTAHVDDPTGPMLDRARGVVRSRVTRRRRLRIGLVAAVAAAAVAIPVVGFDGGTPVDSAAAAVLDRAAAAAGRQHGGWPHAAYWHAVSQYADGSGRPVRREIWIAHHGSGVLRDPGVQAGLVALGAGTFPTGATEVTWDELYRLPTDASALSTALRERIQGAGPNEDAELFTIVGDLLRESPAAPQLREALLHVAAAVPGVSSDGATTDALGRRGVGVSRDGTQYVIDPNTGRLLEEREGTLVTTYLAQGPASSEPQR